MTTSKRFTFVALALLTVSLVASPAMAAASPATPTENSTIDSVQAENDTRGADLSIREMDYADGSVAEQTANGTPIYVVEGEEVLIRPQNFDSGNVVDYRVSTVGGELTYDSEFDAYIFRPGDNATGTYDISWSVTRTEEEIVTENNTTVTRTETVNREYIAKIRVDGKTNLKHISGKESERRQHYREVGKTVNRTNQELRDRWLPFIKNDGSDLAIYQALVSRGVSTGNPYNLLTGKMGAILFMIITALGGWALLTVNFGSFGALIYKLKKRLHIFETIEEEEGEVADRLAEADQKERKRAAQNVDWNNVIEDDHFAAAFRELGENFHDGVHALTASQLVPENWVRDRLQAADQCGYRVDVTRDDDELADATVVAPADVNEDDDTEAIGDLLDDGLVDAVDWGDPELKAFDLPTADYDRGKLDTEPVTTNLDELLRTINLQMEDFPNQRVAGEYLREFIESELEHDHTDRDGTVNGVREVLNNFLKVAQVGTGRHDLPMQYVSEAIERGLIDHDPNEEALELSREVRAGGAD